MADLVQTTEDIYKAIRDQVTNALGSDVQAGVLSQARAGIEQYKVETLMEIQKKQSEHSSTLSAIKWIVIALLALRLLQFIRGK